MNIPITASKIIDRAILLEEGGAIVIPCSSYEEMEKLRVRLYKLKRQLEGSYRDIALSLDIKRKIGTNRWTLFITKDTSLLGVFIIEDGEAKPFILDEIEPELKPEIEEVIEEKEEIKVEDFDDVAASIEASQGLIIEEKLESLKKRKTKWNKQEE